MTAGRPHLLPRLPDVPADLVSESQATTTTGSPGRACPPIWKRTCWKPTDWT